MSSASRSAVRWWPSCTDPGLFRSAELAAASDDNERNSVLIRTPEGAEVVAVQIAGLVARRIVCDIAAGDKVTIGDTYGLIRFGSRLDTYLPEGVRSARAARPACCRRRDDPREAAAMKPRVKRPVVSLRMLPSAMTVAAICLGPVGGQVRARQPADRGDGVPGRRGDSGRARRPHRTAAQGHVEDGRGDRLAGRRGELRCGTGVHRLRDAAVALADRLDRRAALRGVHRAAAGPVQHNAGRGQTRLHQPVLRRHARAGGRNRRDRAAGRQDAVR